MYCPLSLSSQEVSLLLRCPRQGITAYYVMYKMYCTLSFCFAATPAPPPKDRAGQLSLYIAKAHEACFQREKELRKLVDELNKEIDARQAIIDSFHWEPQQTVFSDQEEEDLQKRGLMGGARWEMYQPGDQPMDGDHEDVDMSE